MSKNTKLKGKIVTGEDSEEEEVDDGYGAGYFDYGADDNGSIAGDVIAGEYEEEDEDVYIEEDEDVEVEVEEDEEVESAALQVEDTPSVDSTTLSDFMKSPQNNTDSKAPTSSSLSDFMASPQNSQQPSESSSESTNTATDTATNTAPTVKPTPTPTTVKPTAQRSASTAAPVNQRHAIAVKLEKALQKTVGGISRMSGMKLKEIDKKLQQLMNNSDSNLDNILSIQKELQQTHMHMTSLCRNMTKGKTEHKWINTIKM